MGSRGNREAAAAHQPLLSSLVVRLTDNERTADFEPGEVNRHSRSTRFYQDPPGYRVHAGSVSPVRLRNGDHHFNSTFAHSDDMPHRGRGRGRDSGKFNESPPRFSRGRGGARPLGRGSAGHVVRSGPFRGETTGKSNPNVQPREGDWYCSDPACNNLNFARRDHCNNCHRPRRGTEISPRRGRLGSPPTLRRISSMDQSPRRTATNGYRSPPRLARNYGVDHPLERGRREDKFADRHIRRDQPGYLDDGFDQRSRFDRREPPMGYAPRELIRDNLYNDRKGYERRLASPPLSSLHPPASVAPGRWVRDRSRSPIILRDELPLKDYRRSSYMERGRNERRDPLPLSTVPHSPPVASGRWARERSRSPLRSELPPPKDYRRDAYVDRGRDGRHGHGHGLARGRDPY